MRAKHITIFTLYAIRFTPSNTISIAIEQNPLKMTQSALDIWILIGSLNERDKEAYHKYEMRFGWTLQCLLN